MKELVIPWPDRVLHPNARPHWATKARAAKKARKWGALAAQAAGWHTFTLPEGRLYLWIDGYAKTRHAQDADGFLSALKPWLDGIADAMGINDARFMPRPFIKDEVRNPPEVRIRITGGPET